MSIKMILFDLDGTLLPMDQNHFVKTYFGALAKKLAPLGYDPEKKEIRPFRVDRMDGVILCYDKPREGQEAYDAIDKSAYTNYTFSMYGGEIEKVTMVFQNRMMNAVIDRFGKDVLAVPEDKSHFRITVPVAVSQQFFGWVFGLGKSVRIVEPESVKKQMMKALADIAERYEE